MVQMYRVVRQNGIEGPFSPQAMAGTVVQPRNCAKLGRGIRPKAVNLNAYNGEAGAGCQKGDSSNSYAAYFSRVLGFCCHQEVTAQGWR